MALLSRLAALLLLLPLAWTQDRCEYFTTFPQSPPPEFEDENLDVPWNERPLLPPPERPDLCMDSYSPGVGVQGIYILEEIVDDIIVAKLNYNGDGFPVIGSYLNGFRSALGAVVRREPGLDNGWYLVITQPQDYETASMRQYLFNVDVFVDQQETNRFGTIMVSLNIVNIDDNDPIIHLVNDCTVPEMGEPGPTECSYDVTDADGDISINHMTFKIEGSRNEDQLFVFDETKYPTDLYRMTITLRTTTALDFAARALHIFTVTASDSFPNTHEVTMLVQVENVEHRPPRWVQIWAMQRLNEKSYQTYAVSAIDGDTGIDKQILYRLNKNETYTFFDIDNESGEFTVTPIDRDALEQEVFQLQIVAYKFDNEDFNEVANVVIIVDDINDQFPLPLSDDEYVIDIPEETLMSLNFEDFGFHDRDLGPNAEYSVELISMSPPEVATAFSVAPTQGYQRQTFIMSVADHSRLDYDDLEVDYKQIVIEFRATELHDTTRTGTATVRVNLINWNDELPIFELDVYDVTIEETVPAGTSIATVRANDRDIGDRVVYSLMGNVNFLRIDPDTGEITVSEDDAFNYHRQNEITVQIRAEDTMGDGPYHSTTAQLIIRLIDINNTPPQLRLPRSPPMVRENVPDGFPITTEIHGTDQDTTADIYFEIEWETSYATKQGRAVDPDEYVGCVEIITVYPDEVTRGTANGTIVVRELVGRPGVTIDFEEFEVLYLTIRVVDRNTVIGDNYAESAFTVIIIDMNDNSPIWTQSTIETPFSVREMSLEGVVIGSVHATDIDGPMYNQIRYSIIPINETPEDLVRIDPLMGQIEVLTSGAIDADVPRRDNLYFTVVASDCCNVDCLGDDPICWDASTDITVRIIDTNNKIPEVLEEDFNPVVYVWENATTGDEILQLFAHDSDRDEIYHTVAYQINYAVNPGLRDFFQIDLETGLIMVYYTSDRVLDRDRGEPRHEIFVNIIDNFYSQGDGNRNQPAEIELTVILRDVNDNAPELPPPSEQFWSISEGLTQGDILDPDIYAPDIDEPDTDNSRVNYLVLSLNILDRDIEVPELFGMINVNNEKGELYCQQDLRGYWGTYAIHILAYDLGHPQQSSEETYELVIEPYNFHPPQFVYPSTPGTTVRLARELATVTWPLTLVNGEFLDRMEATDEDGLDAGVVTFSVTGNALAEDYFVMDNDGPNMATLRLSQPLPEDQIEFQVTITATDRGTVPGPLSTSTSMRLIFVPTQGDPVFTQNTDTAAFFELEEGLEESAALREAVDPKNLFCNGDCHDIYYYIFDGNDAGHFSLESTSNVLRVVSALDRAESETHQLTIGASNSPTQPNFVPGPDSLLTVTVAVREANPQPRFQRNLYTAGISTADSINRELLTLVAVHSEGDSLTYTIDWESMVLDSSLEQHRDSAFILNPQTGVLLLNMQPSASMHGMFEFDAVATDTSGVTDRTHVKIYLISSMNRVTFIFVNTLTDVEQKDSFIAQTFSVGFDMTCHIDEIVPAADDSGAAQEDLTEVRAHFIEDDVPVPAEVIQLKREDIALLRQIQNTLSMNLLILRDLFVGLPPDNSGPNIERVMQNVLAVVSAVLAVMCVVLLLAYCIRTRALNRRLEAMSTTIIDPMESKDSAFAPGNGMVVHHPNTNQFAVIGSNPVWNEETKAPDFDAISHVSYGSDLIGIEDDPQFSYNAHSGTPAASTSNNNNGIAPPASGQDSPFTFNTTPFTKEFGNKDFRMY